MGQLTMQASLPPTYPYFTAFGEEGEYIRKAQTVGELPHPMRHVALKLAEQVLNVQQIQYGVPIYQTLGLKKSEIDTKDRDWMYLSGDSLPLSLFWTESNSEEEM